jgi:outer membrane protein TolC
MSPHSRVLRRAAPALLALLLAPAAATAQEEEVLTLDAAVRHALLESPEVQRAGAARLAGGAERADAWQRMLPSLSFYSGLTRADILQRTASDPVTGGIVQLPDSLVQDRRSFGTRNVVSASWVLFAGGRDLAHASAVRSRSRGAEHALTAARVRAAAEATLAYLDVLEAEALVEVRRAEEEHARELERTAEARFETGEVPELDLLQARLARSDAEIALIDAEGEARVLRAVLLDGLRLPPGTRYALAPPPPAPPLDTVALRAGLLESSPVLAALHARREGAARELRAGRLSLLPTVAVAADRVWSEWGQSREAFTLEPRNTQAFYRISFSWTPLERPAGLLADRQRSSGALMEAEAELRAAVREVEREVSLGVERWARA